MAAGRDGVGRGKKRIAAALLDCWGFAGETLPATVAARVRRVRFCLTFGWTPEQYDRMDMATLDEMMLILEKAGNFRIPLRLGV